MRYIRRAFFENDSFFDEVVSKQDYESKKIVEYDEYNKPTSFSFYKDWTTATNEEIDAMTFDDAAEMIEETLDKEGQPWGIRTHYAQALRIVLTHAMIFDEAIHKLHHK